MAKFRVETQLAIDKASAQGAKVAMEGLTKAATQLGGALVGGKAFLAPFKLMRSVIEDSIAASEKATAAQQRMGESMKNVYKIIGDEMTPGLDTLARSIQSALDNPAIVQSLEEMGQLLGDMAVGVSAVVDELGGFDQLATIVEDLRNFLLIGNEISRNPIDFLTSPGKLGADLAAHIKSQREAIAAGREYQKGVSEITAAVGKWAKGVGEQQKAEEKAAEARKKAHAEHLKALQAILDKVNPIAKAEREAWQQILTLNQALKAGEVDVNTYQQALAFLTAELKKVQEAGQLVAATIATIEMPSRLDGVGEIGANPFAGGSMTVSQSPYVEEMMRAEEQFSANLAQGMGAAAATFAREFLETGEFNIKALGDMLLDVLLDAAMQYFAQMVANQAKLQMTSSATGAAGATGGAGMLAGAGWVGLAVAVMAAYAASTQKKKGEEFRNNVNYTAGISGGIVQSDWKFTDASLEAGKEASAASSRFADAMGTYLEAFRQVTGNTITGLGEIAVGIRHDGAEFEAMFAGEVIGHFKTLEEAMVAGIQAAFKAEDFAGTLDPILRQVVENYQGDAEGFLSAIERVDSILDEISGLSEIEVALRDLPKQSASLAGELQGLGVSMADAAAISAQWQAQQMQDLRDQITGHQKSEAEMLAQRQREAEMFNAQLALDKAKNDAEILNLQNQIAIENAKVDVLNAANQAQLAILNASLAAYQQIAAIYTSITPINLGEIRLPGTGRNRPRGGGNTTPTGPTPEEIAAQLAEDIAAFWADIAAGWLASMGPVSAAIAELNRWYEEQAARARELGLPLGELNDLYAQQLLNLQNDTLASLGLQSIATIEQFAALREALKYLRDWGAITAEQLRELGASMYISLVDSLLQYVDNEDVRRQLEDLRFRMELANYQLQFQLLLSLGLLTQAEIDIIAGLITGIQDAYNAGELDFQLPEVPRNRPQQHRTDPREEARQRALDALRSALDRLRNAVDGLREFHEGMTLSAATPLTLSQQYEEAARQYAAMLAAAQGGDLEAIEGLAGAAQTYLDLAAQMFGTGGSGYGAIFQAVSDQIAAVLAASQAVLDAAPDQMTGVEDRLDNTNAILAEILRLFPNGNNRGANQNLGGMGGSGNMANLAGGNVTLGNFGGNPGVVSVRSPEITAELRAIREAQTAATLEAKNDRMKKPAVGFSGYLGHRIGSGRSS